MSGSAAVPNELRATARLQFHKDFTLDDARALVPYFARLGISHLYASPLLKARPGSMHGYDIVDHDTINPELGGEAALQRLSETLRAHDMGLILDIVPNHMGVGGADNAWWLDVLEWGRASPYANYFDIDWEPPTPALRHRLLAPFLGSSYGECLMAGDFVPRFDPEDGRLFVAYHEHRFPIRPQDYADMLRSGGLEALAAPLEGAGGGREALRRRAEQVRAALRDPAHRPGIDAALAAFAPDTEAGRARLHRLLERQHYRLAWWRAAADEINWRRFFDVNSLAGIRVELPEVFEATHRTILQLYADATIDGVRVDHVDGLADPRGYCRKLRRRLEAAAQARPTGLRDIAPVLWVEKILAPHERLPFGWLVDGTTGYDFMNEASGVLHDPAGQTALLALWSGLTGRPADFATVAETARHRILRDSLASELLGAAGALHRVASRDLMTRDWTVTTLHAALTELLVHFPVYRIYAGPGGPSAADRNVLDWALAGARRTARRANQPLLDLVVEWLSGAALRSVPPGQRRQERLRAMVRFQQLSAPTAAKSVEDTAFYRYGVLLSRNEVGSDPAQFAITPAAFHASARLRGRRHPRELLATATHDHKRGEDTRARLAVLSEIPDAWEAALTRWTRLNATLKRDIDGPAPDPADELMLYQMLVGAWPLGLAAEDRDGVAAFASRVAAWQEKALREAKLHSSWAAPNVEYETACRDFLMQCLDPDRPTHVAQEIAAFAARIAAPGAINGLAQTLLRLAAPGVPDLYQGTEFWDFSLVDPDNRRPVNYAARQTALAAGDAPAALLPTWQDGRVKQAIIARALAFRARAPALFAGGEYAKLRTEGRLTDHVLAFVRTHQSHAIVAIATRLTAKLPGTGDKPLVTPTAWQGTATILPRRLHGCRITDVLSGEGIAGTGSRLMLRDILANLPVALLEVR